MMVNNKNIYLEYLKKLKPKKEDLIIRYLRNFTFCRVLIAIKSLIEAKPSIDFIYTRDIKRALNISRNEVHENLNDMVDLGWIRKKRVNYQTVVFYPIKNNNKMIIDKYIQRAIETLKDEEMI